MPDSFGARLRQRREERLIDLIAISEQTKIKLSLLEALERDDVSQWPSGIFRRAYIRAYAQMIGLDPDVVVREFLDAYPDPGDAFVMTAAAAAAAEEAFARTTGPSVRIRTIVDSAIGSWTRLRRPAGSDELRPDTAEARAPAESDLHIDNTPPPAPGDAAGETSAPALEDPRTEPAKIEETIATPVPQPPAASPAAEARSQSAGREVKTDAAIEAIAAEVQADHDATLETLARVCTELGRVVDRQEVQRLLQDSARALNATGLIVWLWDEIAEALRPGLVHGYSEEVLAHVPAVKPDADNATAAAFRNSSACEVAPARHTSGALVVPMLIPDACVGVLALELHPGVEPSRSLRAAATVLAAALTQLVHRSQPPQQRPQAEPPAAAVAQFRPPVQPRKVRR